MYPGDTPRAALMWDISVFEVWLRGGYGGHLDEVFFSSHGDFWPIS